MPNPENRPETGLNQRVGGRFAPGVSGNPGGRPKVTAEAKDALRAALPRAIQRLRELMDSDDERVALSACQAVIDRNLGKLPMAEDADASAGVLDGLTQEQLMAIVEKGQH